MVAVIDPRRHVAIVGVYGVFLIGAAVVALVRNPDLTPGQLVFFWLYANGPGTVLLLTFLRRRVRAVGPMVLAFMVTGVTGAVLAIQVVGSSAKLMRTAVAIGSSLGLSATELLVLLHLFVRDPWLGFAALDRPAIPLEARKRPVPDAGCHVAAVRRRTIHNPGIRRLGLDIYRVCGICGLQAGCRGRL